MSKQLSLTVPDPIYDALAAKGAFYDMTAGDVLKSFLLQSAEIEDSRLFIKPHIDGAKAAWTTKAAPEKSAMPADELPLDAGDEEQPTS